MAEVWRLPGVQIDYATPLALAGQRMQNEQFRTESPLRAAILEAQAKEAKAVAEDKEREQRQAILHDAFQRALIEPDRADDIFREAADQGATEARQFVGRASPLKLRQWANLYAPSAPTASGRRAGTSDGGMSSATASEMDAAYADYTPEQMVQTLQHSTALVKALEPLMAPGLSELQRSQIWDQQAQQLEAVMPGAAQAAGQYNMSRAADLYMRAEKARAYLGNRLLGSAAGMPDPIVPIDAKVADGAVIGIDPRGRARTLAKRSAVADGVLTEYDPVTGEARALTARYDKLGSGDQLFRTIPEAVGEPLPLAALVDRIGMAESAGRVDAKNPLSTATGAHQFIDSTWMSMMKAYHPELTRGKSRAEVLALRKDPALSREMATMYAQDNARELQEAGLPVTSANIYLAHGFGPEGAKRILTAAPDTPIGSLFDSDVIKANPHLRGKTAQQVVQRFAAAVGNRALAEGGPGGSRVVAQGAPKPGYRVATAEEKVAAGLAPEAPAQVSPDGKIEPIGEAVTAQAMQKLERRAEQHMGTASNVLRTIDEVVPQIGSGEAGAIGAWTRFVPGTTAYDVGRAIETIKANLGFQELQAMREASPTGGALGQVAVQELVALQATVANLDQGQKRETLLKNLRAVKNHVERWRDAVIRATYPPGTRVITTKNGASVIVTPMK